MKNYTKFLAIFLALALLLAVPVFAADGWHTFHITSDDWRTTAYYDYGFEPGDYFPQVGTLQENTNRLQYYFPDHYDGIQGADNLGFLFEANFRLNVSAGDILTIDAFTLNWFIGDVDNYVEEVHLYAGKAITTPNNDGIFRLNIMTSQAAYATGYTSGQAVQSLNVPQTELQVLSDGVIDTLWLGFRIYHPDKGSFNVLRVPLTIHYGNPNSPEAPSYSPPESDNIDEYDDLEGGLLGSVAGNQGAIDDIYTGFSIDPFLVGLSGWIALFGVVLPRLDWLQTLITASLAFGLFAFIFNIVTIVIQRYQYKGKGGN